MAIESLHGGDYATVHAGGVYRWMALRRAPQREERTEYYCEWRDKMSIGDINCQ